MVVMEVGAVRGGARGTIVSPGDGLIGVVVIETGVEVRILVYWGGGGSEL
jgi:hypothetical protein